MNTVMLILVIAGFIVFDRIVRHKPEDQKNKNANRNKGNGNDQT